jgi:hypothetical protein
MLVLLLASLLLLASMLLPVSLLLLTSGIFTFFCPPDCCQRSGCEVLLLLLASLLNVAGFSTAAAVIPDVNGFLLQASLLLLHGVSTVLVVLLLLFLLSFLLFLGFLLLWAVMLSLSS